MVINPSFIDEISLVIKICLQIVTVIAIFANMCLIAIRFKYMKYSFYYIMIRYLFYWDTKPISWLSENLSYLYYIILEFGQFMVLIGLLHQLYDKSVATKPIEFSIGGPISYLMILLIFIDLFAKLDSRSPIHQLINRTLKNKRNK